MIAEGTTLAFSVVVPTYRRNDLLARCLDALAPGRQTLDAARYEVIVTDDAPAPHNVDAMIRERFGWARWTQGPGRGPAANRNHGARQARYAHLVFTDDDCIPSPRWLQAYAEALSPKFAVYEGRTTCAGGLPSPLYAAPVNETGGYLWSCNMMLARAVFESLGGFDESYPFPAMEDVDFRERLKTAGFEFPFVAGAVVDHPPRRMPSPTRRVELDESIYWHHARKGAPLSLGRMARDKVRFRLREILAAPKGADSIRAVGALVAELVALRRLYATWQQKYLAAGRP